MLLPTLLTFLKAVGTLGHFQTFEKVACLSTKFGSWFLGSCHDRRAPPRRNDVDRIALNIIHYMLYVKNAEN